MADPASEMATRWQVSWLVGHRGTRSFPLVSIPTVVSRRPLFTYSCGHSCGLVTGTYRIPSSLPASRKNHR